MGNFYGGGSWYNTYEEARAAEVQYQQREEQNRLLREQNRLLRGENSKTTTIEPVNRTFEEIIAYRQDYLKDHFRKIEEYYYYIMIKNKDYPQYDENNRYIGGSIKSDWELDSLFRLIDMSIFNGDDSLDKYLNIDDIPNTESIFRNEIKYVGKSDNINGWIDTYEMLYKYTQAKPSKEVIDKQNKIKLIFIGGLMEIKKLIEILTDESNDVCYETVKELVEKGNTDLIIKTFEKYEDAIADYVDNENKTNVLYELIERPKSLLISKEEMTILENNTSSIIEINIKDLVDDSSSNKLKIMYINSYCNINHSGS